MALFQQGMFQINPRDTPETIARKRALANQIMNGPAAAPRSTADGIGNMFGSIMGGIAARNMNNKADAAERAGQESAASAFNPLLDAFRSRTGLDANGFPAAPNPGDSASMAATPAPDYASARVAQAHGDSGGGFLPQSFLSAVDRTEGAGGYDTLFGHAQRGKFAGTDVSSMSVGEALAFADPRGAYGQHVRNQIGRVATPMGRHQIVGTTLRNASREMGLDPSTPFNAQTQDQIAAHLARRRIAGAQTMDGKIAGLRSEWEGFKSVPRAQMEQIVRDLEQPAAPAVQANVGGLTPDALQQWAFANYAQQPHGDAVDAVDAVNGLATGTLPDPAQWPDIQRRAMASAPADPATWPQRQAELMRETSPQWLNDMIDGNGVPVAETEADILAQEQAMMAQDPQAFQQPGAGAPQAAAGQYAPLMPHQPAPPLPDPRMVQDMPVAPMQVAQAGGFPEMAGRNPQAIPAPGIDMQMIANVLTNPFSNPEQRAFAQMLLEQQMQAQDPMRQADLAYKQAQTQKLQRELSGELGDAAKVQSSTILDDGTSVLVMNDGSRRVLSPTGETVTGQAAADAIRSARQYTVENQREIYGGRRAGTLGADIELGGAAAGAAEGGKKTMEAGFSAWDDYNKIQGSIANIDEAIAALDNGAKSGIVYNMLPNVTEASASLKNAMDRMGLDVIGSVTFGALSEGEMRLAMETAVPRSLQPTELRNWLQRKRDAQEKASRTLADAAMFLTVPGNTINDWIAKNRGQGSASSTGSGDGDWQDMGGVRIRRKQ